MVTVKLHRWQAKTKRYNTQTLNLEDARPFLDLVAGRGVGVSQLIDPAVNQKILRTQQIDRVNVQTEYDYESGETTLGHVTVDIYLSPFQGRNYPDTQARKTLAESFLGSAITKRGKRDDQPRCQCFHRHIEHAEHGVTICLVPGCNCKLYQPQQPKSPLQLRNRLEVLQDHPLDCRCESCSPIPAGQ